MLPSRVGQGGQVCYVGLQLKEGSRLLTTHRVRDPRVTRTKRECFQVQLQCLQVQGTVGPRPREAMPTQSRQSERAWREFDCRPTRVARASRADEPAERGASGNGSVDTLGAGSSGN